MTQILKSVLTLIIIFIVNYSIYQLQIDIMDSGNMACVHSEALLYNSHDKICKVLGESKDMLQLLVANSGIYNIFPPLLVQLKSK